MASTAGSPPQLAPPHINLPSISNLRDVSPSLPPPTSSTDPLIQPNLLYRSADPSSIGLETLALLHKTHHIRTIYDLRSAPEVGGSDADEFEEKIAVFNASHDGTACTICKLSPGRPAVKRLWTPVFPEDSYTPERLAIRFANYGSVNPAEGFAKGYAEILAAGTGVYAQIVNHLSTPNVGATLVHCTAGKDRTGVLVALVLSLASVSPERIAADYSLTEQGLAHKRPGMVARLAMTGAFGDDETKALEAATRMGGARPESMIATLNMIKEKYGGAEGYVVETCGVDENTVESLRRRFMVGASSGQATL
jgi:protein tyrosine/serine phosphatase